MKFVHHNINRTTSEPDNLMIIILAEPEKIFRVYCDFYYPKMQKK